MPSCVTATARPAHAGPNQPARRSQPVAQTRGLSDERMSMNLTKPATQPHSQLYSYTVAMDHGFAPNPFFGYCTLATCKPIIRRCASVGDWVIGTGSKVKQRDGHMVFAMRVDETMSYNQYWSDSRFAVKKPNMRSSDRRHKCGDNIYHTDDAGKWIQQESYHSMPHSGPCDANLRRDTQTDRVLISRHFTYWGGTGPPIRFADICSCGRGHRRIPLQNVQTAVAWLEDFKRGYCGDPLEWGPVG